MKKEKISQALNEMDESYIEKAATYRKKSVTTPIMKWGALAASLALVIAGTAIVMPHLTSTQPELPETTPSAEHLIVTEAAGEQETINETAPSGWTTQGDGLESTMEAVGIRYSFRVEEGPYKSYRSMAVMEESAVGEKLADISVKGFWHDLKVTFEEAEPSVQNVEHLRAEVYSIKGVSSATAVCVKYLDQGEANTTTHYYTFVNTEEKAETLTEFFADLNANAYFSVKTVNAHISRLTSGTQENAVYVLKEENASTLRSMLLALNGSAIEYTEKETLPVLLQNCKVKANLPIDFDSLGSYSAGALVLDNGYLIFNIFSTNEFAFAFDIGEEKAKELIAYVEENMEKKIYTGEETITFVTETTTAELVYE